MKNLDGIFTALLTPFDKYGNINKAELCHLVDHNLKMGVRGFYVTGSTGEAFSLSEEERMMIMETVRNRAPEATLIAHVGSLDERVAKRLALRARELGYDLVSSVAPFYYKFSFSEIKGYYERIADTSEKLNL